MNLNELIKSAKSKNEVAMEDIMKRFTPLVIRRANSIYIKGYTLEDLIQIGYMTIIRAVYSYDINKNKSFPSYVSRAIRNNYNYLLRKISKENHDTSYEKELDKNKYNLNVNQCEMETPEDKYIKKWEFEKLMHALSKLSKKDREIIICSYKKGYGALKKYSRENNIKYGTLQKRKKAILKKLKKYMTEE